jgi:RNA polymerase sigma-70 factor (ECF subfamily)
MTDSEAWQASKGVPESEEEFLRLLPGLVAPVCSYLRRVGCTPEESQELAQEALLRAWRSLGHLQSKASLRTWLFAIAKNVYVNHIRHHNSLKRGNGVSEHSLDDFSGDHFHDCSSPSEDLLQRESRTRLYDAVATLPTMMRCCLLLRVYHGLPTRDIAAQLGITDASVRAHLYQARKSLRTKLHDHTGKNE